MPDFCAYYKENICRSCSIMETAYPQQITTKEEVLKNALSGILNVSLDKTVTSSEQSFRNKAKIVVSGTMEKPILGLIDKEILDCPVHDPAINKILHDLLPFITLCKLEPYQIKERKGELKGIILFHGDEAYVRFVLRSKEGLDRIKKNLPDLLRAHPEITSVSVNIQPVHQAILEGEEEIILGPEQAITQKYGSLALKLRPQAFVQTNQVVAAILYGKAASWVKEKKIENFLELFSGQGAFSFHCAGFVRKATGIEINPEAVKMANETAQLLGLKHLSFIALDAGKSEEIIQKNNPDLILVNPPRRGLSESLGLIRKTAAPWVIYSSCSVETLAKDLRELSTDYEIEKIGIYDMFPHTHHFETLVLLKRLSPVKT